MPATITPLPTCTSPLPSPSVARPGAQLDAQRLATVIGSLRASAYRFTASRDDAEDLVQETLARYLRRPRPVSTSDPTEDLTAYLTRALRNTWISEHRHRTCQPVCQELRADDQNEVRSDDPDPVLRLTGHATWAKFASLPAHHREVVLAVDVGGLSYDEAAIALAIPVGTVMSRLYRARRRLASLLPAA